MPWPELAMDSRSLADGPSVRNPIHTGSAVDVLTPRPPPTVVVLLRHTTSQVFRRSQQQRLAWIAAGGRATAPPKDEQTMTGGVGEFAAVEGKLPDTAGAGLAASRPPLVAVGFRGLLCLISASRAFLHGPANSSSQLRGHAQFRTPAQVAAIAVRILADGWFSR